jgi:WD40 repeat protein
MKIKLSVSGLFVASVAVIILIGILAFYQLFSSSPTVDSRKATVNYTFTGHKSIVTSVRFSNNDSFLITGSVDSTIKIWERNTGRLVMQMKQPQGISYLDVSSDGKYIATGSYDSMVRIWDVDNGKQLKVLMGHKGTIWTVSFSSDGKMLASSGDDAVIKIWDVCSGKLLRELKGHQRIVWSVKFSNDGTQLASGSFDYTMKLWNTKDGSLIWDNKEHNEAVVDLAFSHNGTLLATTSDDKTIRVWDMNTRRLVRMFEVPEHVQAVAFSPDDRYLLTGGRDKPLIGEFLQNIFGDSYYNKGVSARLWDVQTGELLQTFSHHANDVMDVTWSHDGERFATASADGTVDLWKISKR